MPYRFGERDVRCHAVEEGRLEEEVQAAKAKAPAAVA
jgi:hypothetical protein